MYLLKGQGISHQKGCIRYSKPERINFDLVESMLRATQESPDRFVEYNK